MRDLKNERSLWALRRVGQSLAPSSLALERRLSLTPSSLYLQHLSLTPSCLALQRRLKSSDGLTLGRTQRLLPLHLSLLLQRLLSLLNLQINLCPMNSDRFFGWFVFKYFFLLTLLSSQALFSSSFSLKVVLSPHLFLIFSLVRPYFPFSLLSRGV
jgi:hypothetical protein